VRRATFMRGLAALTIAALAALSVAASAPGGRRIDLPEAGASFTPPSGWTEDPGLARSVGRAFATEAELVGARGQKLRTGERAWTSPESTAGKGVLHVQWIVATRTTAAADIPALVRAELDDTRERPRFTTIPRGSFELVAWNEAVDGAVAWGQLEFRHLDNETRTLVRRTLFVDALAHLHELRVECVMTDGEAAKRAGDALAPRTGCEAAMAGLHVDGQASLLALGDVPGQGGIRVTGGENLPPEEDDRPDGGLELKAVAPNAASAGVPTVPIQEPPPAAGSPGKLPTLLVVGGVVILVMVVAFGMTKKRKPGVGPPS
jgi:hypothetical protein